MMLGPRASRDCIPPWVPGLGTPRVWRCPQWTGSTTGLLGHRSSSHCLTIAGEGFRDLPHIVEEKSGYCPRSPTSISVCCKKSLARFSGRTLVGFWGPGLCLVRDFEALLKEKGGTQIGKVGKSGGKQDKVGTSRKNA